MNLCEIRKKTNFNDSSFQLSSAKLLMYKVLSIHSILHLFTDASLSFVHAIHEQSSLKLVRLVYRLKAGDSKNHLK